MSSGARSFGLKSRRKIATHTTSISGAGGTLIASYGLVRAPQPGWSSQLSTDPSYSASARLYNLKQSIPIYGKDPNLAGNRAIVGLGIGVGVGGKILRHVAPWVRRTFKIKIARHHKLALV